MNRNIVILLTACLNPNGMSFTALQDVETRKRQYLEAIAYYLRESRYDVVAVENTGADLSQSITIPRNKKFEYLTFQGNDYDKKLGKGYGEAQIIRYAIQHSQLIKNACHVIKITGRIKILNINTLVCCWWNYNSKCTLIQTEFHGENALSICFISTKEWLMQTIKKYGNLLNDTQGFYFEHMLYLSIVESKHIYVLPCFPIIEGISGTKAKRYKNTRMLDRRIDSYYSLSCIYRNKREYGMFLFAKISWFRYALLNKVQGMFA